MLQDDNIENFLKKLAFNILIMFTFLFYDKTVLPYVNQMSG